MINDAHQPGSKEVGGVTCLASTTGCDLILSGGSDGEVHLWSIGKQVKKKMSAQKIHKGPVTKIEIIDPKHDSLCASSSLDGSIILWEIQKIQKLIKID